MTLPGVSPRAKRALNYIFSLVPESENMELICASDGESERVSLLVSVRNGGGNFYYVADAPVLKKLKTDGLIGTATFEESMFILKHAEPFQQTLLKEATAYLGFSDIAEAVPHYQKGGEIRTVYPVMPGLSHNYGLQEVSAELVDPKRGNRSGPYRSIPSSETGPLSLDVLFGLPRLDKA